MMESPAVWSWRAFDLDGARGLSDARAVLACLAVDLLCGPERELTLGAQAAVERRLAGLFLFGLQALGSVEDALPPPALKALRRGAHRELIDDAVSEQEVGEILGLLGARGNRPVVLKGRILALEGWPRSWHRPPGDLDLLVEPEAVHDVVEALEAAGYRRSDSRRCPEFFATILQPPQGRRTPVDLHWRLFNPHTVGSRIDTEPMLRRAWDATVVGHRVQKLDGADELLFLMVHAAGHGFRRLKWILDLCSVALRADQGTWERAALRALASGESRSFHLSAGLLARLPGISIDAKILRGFAPGLPTRAALDRLVNLERAVREDPLSPWEERALRFLLDDGAPARFRRAVRFLSRKVHDVMRRTEPRGRSSKPAHPRPDGTGG